MWCPPGNCSHERAQVDILINSEFFIGNYICKNICGFIMSCFFSCYASHGPHLLPFQFDLLPFMHHLQSGRFPWTDLRTAISFLAQRLTDPNCLMRGLAWTHSGRFAMEVTLWIFNSFECIYSIFSYGGEKYFWQQVIKLNFTASAQPGYVFLGSRSCF